MDEESSKEFSRSLWWDPHLYDQDITVTVDQGIVICEGTVPTPAEVRLVRKIAKEAGAEQIRNHLHVTGERTFFTPAEI